MTSNDPAAVVQRQLDAYNEKDIEALVAVYADDARLFEHPGKLLASGSAELRVRFATRFLEPNLRAELRHRAILGNVVIDHEMVTRTFPEGEGRLEMVMIYEVRDGRIAQAWAIAGAKTIGAGS